jgi:hypothetical protein
VGLNYVRLKMIICHTLAQKLLVFCHRVNVPELLCGEKGWNRDVRSMKDPAGVVVSSPN